MIVSPLGNGMTDQFILKELRRYDSQSPAVIIRMDAFLSTENVASLPHPRRMISTECTQSSIQECRSTGRDMMPALFHNFADSSMIAIQPRGIGSWNEV